MTLWCGLILVAFTGSVYSTSNLLTHSEPARHAVSLDISPNHESALWARDTGKDVQCPASVKAVLEHNKRAVTLSLQLNDERKHAVPVTLDDGVSITTHQAPATGCIYRDDESQADVVLRPKQRGMHVSGRFMTPDGVYGLETDNNLQHFAYQIATEDAVPMLKKLASEDVKVAKRQTERYVELMLVFGYHFYQFHLDINNGNKQEAIESIKYYCVQLGREMDYTYKLNKIGLNIVIAGCHIFKTIKANDCLERNRLKEVRAKTGRHGIMGRATLEACTVAAKKLPKADHHMFFTIDDTKSKNGYGLLGMAWIGQICNPNATSIVEAHGVHHTAFIAVHELGHNLGCQHDQVNDPSCDAADLFIMSSTVKKDEKAFAKNSYLFSSCSREYIEYTVGQTTCLDKEVDDSKYDKYYNKQLDMDQQCQQIAGSSKSKYCGGQAGLKDNCLKMYCTHPTTGRCDITGSANTATTCGDKKWCSNNICVKHEQAPSVKECQYGNFKGLGYDETCPKMTVSQCAKPYNLEYCCATCAKLAKGRPKDCPFGDSSDRCKSWISSGAQCYQRKDQCCGTCSKYATGDEDCMYGDIKGRSCQRISAGKCTDEYYQKRCCATCKKFHTGDKNCPYGETDSNCKYIGSSDCYQKGTQERCCKTCPKFATKEPNCAYGDKSSSCKTMWPGKCGEGRYAEDCCATCKKSKTDDPNCPYGDMFKDCANRLPSDCTKPIVAKDCCKMCKEHKSKDPNCPYGDLNRSCKTMSADSCYSKNTQKSCCKTCPKHKTDIKNCEYGDKASWCSSLKNDECYKNADQCCKKCQQFETNIPGCEYGDKTYCDKNAKKTKQFCAKNRDQCCESCDGI